MGKYDLSQFVHSLHVRYEWFGKGGNVGRLGDVHKLWQWIRLNSNRNNWVYKRWSRYINTIINSRFEIDFHKKKHVQVNHKWSKSSCFWLYAWWSYWHCMAWRVKSILFLRYPKDPQICINVPSYEGTNPTFCKVQCAEFWSLFVSFTFRVDHLYKKIPNLSLRRYM